MNKTKREATIQLLDQIGEGLLVGYASVPVLAELLETSDEKAREVLLGYAERLTILPDPDMEELDTLVDMFMDNRAFPPEKRDDAVHVAYMVLNPGLDAMVTWNCRHLANENNRRYLKALTLSTGYSFDFEITTPEGVLVYE